jgi:hypothetical protein
MIAQVRADLPILQTISTKAAYPETALLPEPDEAKPDATEPADPQPTPSSDSTAPAAPSAPKPQP